MSSTAGPRAHRRTHRTGRTGQRPGGVEAAPRRQIIQAVERFGPNSHRLADRFGECREFLLLTRHTETTGAPHDLPPAGHRNPIGMVSAQIPRMRLGGAGQRADDRC